MLVITKKFIQYIQITVYNNNKSYWFNLSALYACQSSLLLHTIMDLNNKVAIITGSAQGLGKAFAARLLEVGVKVCISDVNKDKGEAALKELKEKFGEDKVCFVPCDVTKDEEFRNLFDKAEEYFKVGCVDILGNNAGINPSYGWRKCMEINIMAVMNGTEIAMERMKKAGKPGQIINTASMGKEENSKFQSYLNILLLPFISAGFGPGVDAEMTPYTVSKHGVVQMTRTMALANDGIMHKAICPAWTDTAIVSSANSNEKSSENQIKARLGHF